MSKLKWQHALVLTLMCLFSFSAPGRTPVLKNTKWQAVEELFVADAGTMTITHTLEFGPGRQVRISRRSYMPPHPTMYQNPDGTVDTLPGWSDEKSGTGTYRIRKGILYITYENEDTRECLFLEDGTIAGVSLGGQHVIFKRCTQ